MQHFRPEGGADELSIGRVGDRLEHLRDCRSVLGVQVGINLVEEIEGRGIASLNSKDEGKRTKT